MDRASGDSAAAPFYFCSCFFWHCRAAATGCGNRRRQGQEGGRLALDDTARAGELAYFMGLFMCVCMLYMCRMYVSSIDVSSPQINDIDVLIYIFIPLDISTSVRRTELPPWPR